MRKILFLGVAIALVSTMVGLGVNAQFVDTEAALTRLEAGKLDLIVNGQNGVEVVNEFKCLKPGDTKLVSYCLHNCGCVDGYLDIRGDHRHRVRETASRRPEAEAGDVTPNDGELGDVLRVKITASSDWWPFVKQLYDGYVKDLPASIEINEKLGALWDVEFIVEVYKWSESAADSLAMTDSVEIAMKIVLEQFND